MVSVFFAAAAIGVDDAGNLRWKLRLIALVLAPLLALNLAVAFFGNSAVFPLSPFHLAAKWDALTTYFLHRPRCLFDDHELAPAIAAAEKKHHLPRGLLAALIEVESGGEAHRISPAGAMGPAQLVPSTARELGVRDPFDPEQSIDGGARYLAKHLRRYKDVQLALAAYNAGPGAVRNAIPENGETRAYVHRVMRLWRHHSPAVAPRDPIVSKR